MSRRGDKVKAWYLSGPSVPAVAMTSTNGSDGTPRQRFKKELIRVGKFVKESAGQRFEVTRKMLLDWAETFGRMKGAGVEVPVPSGHSMDSGAKRGNVLEMFVEGDSLYGILEMIGADAIAEAQRNNVSIYSPAEWTDGHGNKYQRPIVHVALTSYPVIPGLSGFEALAASFEERSMDWKKIAEALGIDTEMNEDNAQELILAAGKSRSEKIKALQDEIKKHNDAKAELKDKIEKLKLSHDQNEPKIDTLMASLAGENRELKIQQLVDKGAITPGVAEKLKETFAKGDGLTLSLTHRDKVDLFAKVVEALSDNKPVSPGEKTGPQVLELANTRTGDKEGGLSKALLKDAEARGKTSTATRW